MQMTGMLLGGILWGVLGDKKGRLSVLFGSIALYSLANIANAYVSTVQAYAWWRLAAGVGLAGELGAGITLVSEMMPKEYRGIATSLVAAIGILGAVAAYLVGDSYSWSTAYLVGGFLGLGLLCLRVGVMESGMFSRLASKAEERGDLFRFFWPARQARSYLRVLGALGLVLAANGLLPESLWPGSKTLTYLCVLAVLLVFCTSRKALQYLSVILIGVPLWFVVGILITFSPEVGKALGLAEAPVAGKALMYTYVGLALGDFGSGLVSHFIQSRKKTVLGFLSATTLFMLAYFFGGVTSLSAFYLVCLGLGLACGYWAMFVTIASEQFGTNIRATVTTTVPNFVRGAVPLLTSLFLALKGPLGVAHSAETVGFGFVALAFLALSFLDETYGKDLDYVEDPLI
jgi:MFS family permease